MYMYIYIEPIGIPISKIDVKWNSWRKGLMARELMVIGGDGKFYLLPIPPIYPL